MKNKTTLNNKLEVFLFNIDTGKIWVFGPISNGVLAEIILARKAKKPI